MSLNNPCRFTEIVATLKDKDLVLDILAVLCPGTSSPHTRHADVSIVSGDGLTVHMVPLTPDGLRELSKIFVDFAEALDAEYCPAKPGKRKAVKRK
jgi:hypothetical protein